MSAAPALKKPAAITPAVALAAALGMNPDRLAILARFARAEGWLRDGDTLAAAGDPVAFVRQLILNYARERRIYDVDLPRAAKIDAGAMALRPGTAAPRILPPQPAPADLKRAADQKQIEARRRGIYLRQRIDDWPPGLPIDPTIAEIALAAGLKLARKDGSKIEIRGKTPADEARRQIATRDTEQLQRTRQRAKERAQLDKA